MNHLAMFGTEYLELIAAPPGDSRRPEILAAPEGLNGLVWGTEDSNGTGAPAMTLGFNGSVCAKRLGTKPQA